MEWIPVLKKVEPPKPSAEEIKKKQAEEERKLKEATARQEEQARLAVDQAKVQQAA